jgi:AhpD family alkylhydroperoxidase
MRSTGSAGVVDAETKELINFALVVLSRCGPCFEVHRKKAAEMGLTPDQLEEAAWCAIAMGGAPVRMFYEEMKSRCPDGDAPDSCC